MKNHLKAFKFISRNYYILYSHKTRWNPNERQKFFKGIGIWVFLKNRKKKIKISPQKSLQKTKIIKGKENEDNRF